MENAERQYLERAPLGRLATADAEGRPHVVPICFALDGDEIVTPIDEKPQEVSPQELRRSRDIEENPRVALVVDHYADNWSRLGWIQLRGTAAIRTPDQPSHASAVGSLRTKYHQYESHGLEERPIIRIVPRTVRSWGTLSHPDRPE